MLSAIEKRRIKKVIYSKVTLVVVTVLLVLVARGTWDIYEKAKYASTNEVRVKTELELLKKREEFLNKELYNIRTNRGKEAEIRAKFDVGREGEKLVVLVDAEESVIIQEPKELGFLEKIKMFFIDLRI